MVPDADIQIDDKIAAAVDKNVIQTHKYLPPISTFRWKLFPIIASLFFFENGII